MLIPEVACFPPRTAVSPSYIIIIHVLIHLPFDKSHFSNLSNSRVFVYVIARAGVKF